MTTSKDRPRDLMGALLIALVLFTALLAGCGRTEAPADDKPTPVRIKQASNGPAVPPIFAGWMLGHSTFGWPLVIGGTIKAAYDLLLLRQFRDVRPPEETADGAHAARSPGAHPA